MSGELYYTPERVDRILRNWPRYQAAAEGLRSSLPDSLRPARGKRSDRLGGADIVADVERALALAVRPHTLEYAVLIFVMRGNSLTQIAFYVTRRKREVLEAYDGGVRALANALGWREVPPP